ncbi:MAG: anti-sigma factor, partial [Albidovulum sp.]|uniref:anti-sigma factor n=1 Tax=Albidovulum sp. TaxID=1872424 RepID=UPI003CAEC699
EKLAPLNEGYEKAAPPPDMLNRIEARLFPKPERPHRAGWLWGGLAGAALAALTLVAVLPLTQPPVTVTATLTGEDQPLVIAARYDPEAGALTVNRSDGPPAAAGQDYELWLIPAGEAAISIGLVREGDLTIPLAALPPGATLAVTLEPQGGSPTGVATGPILVAALVEGG